MKKIEDNSENKKYTTLWTIQTEYAYKELVKEGRLITNPEFLMLNSEIQYKIAYDWISDIMKEKIERKPLDAVYPIWTWYSYLGKRKKPDLRCSAHQKKGTKSVLLEVRIPNEEILISDFEMWHYPLNLWYIPVNDEDDEKFDKKYSVARLKLFSDCDMQNPYNNDALMALQEMKKSWKRIFLTVNEAQKRIQAGEKLELQATIWEIRLENVVKVQHFIAK